MKEIDQEELLETFAENLPGAAFVFEVDGEQRETIRPLNSGCEKI